MTANPVWVGLATDPGSEDGSFALSAVRDGTWFKKAVGNRTVVEKALQELVASADESRVHVVSDVDLGSFFPDDDIVSVTDLSRIAIPTLLEQNSECLSNHLELSPCRDPAEEADRIAVIGRLLVERLAGLDHSDLTALSSLCSGKLHGFLETAMALRSRSMLGVEELSPPAAARSAPTYFESHPATACSWDATEDEVYSILKDGGIISKSVSVFEERSEQIELAYSVLRSFRDEMISVIEAPTGTGKTLGYLVPSILWSSSTGRKVVVSTHTITLQDQLFFKDAPQVLGALGVKGRVCVLKGRRNYLCLKRWKTLRASGIQAKERAQLAPIVSWLSATKSGDVAENSGLDLSLDESRRAWAKVSCDLPYCPAVRCSEYRDCFLFKARKAAESAMLIVINHSLLFCDRFLGNALLPSFDELIVDEAHSLENVARDQLGMRVSQGRITAALSEISGTQEPRLLERLLDLSKLAAASGKNTFEPVLKRLAGAIRLSRSEAGAFFDGLEEISSKLSEASRHAGKIRYRVDDMASHELSQISAAFAESLGDVERELGAVSGFAIDLPVDDPQSIVQEIDARAEDVTRLISDLHRLCNPLEGESVYWIESGSGRRAELRSSPVELGDVLYDLIYNELSAMVLTSGTLSYQGGFEYTSETLGLSGPRTTFQRLESSFPLSEQVELFATSSLPRPDAGGHLEGISSFTRNLFADRSASTLVLFTSYASLEQVYAQVREPLEKLGISVFSQGKGEAPQRLAELFRTRPGSLLLGTMSFWEGVDLPGECLERLVITRIPFPVPTEPVVEGIMESLQARGEDPFQKYMLPTASIRLRQGFGRLIRSKDDKGLVFILDSRFLGSSYGPLLAAEMPVDVQRLPGDETLFV